MYQAPIGAYIEDSEEEEMESLEFENAPPQSPIRLRSSSEMTLYLLEDGLLQAGQTPNKGKVIGKVMPHLYPPITPRVVRFLGPDELHGGPQKQSKHRPKLSNPAVPLMHDFAGAGYPDIIARNRGYATGDGLPSSRSAPALRASGDDHGGIEEEARKPLGMDALDGMARKQSQTQAYTRNHAMTLSEMRRRSPSASPDSERSQDSSQLAATTADKAAKSPVSTSGSHRQQPGFERHRRKAEDKARKELESMKKAGAVVGLGESKEEAKRREFSLSSLFHRGKNSTTKRS